MDTVIGLAALVAVAILLVFSCCRARRIDNRLLKWSAMALAGSERRKERPSWPDTICKSAPISRLGPCESIRSKPGILA